MAPTIKVKTRIDPLTLKPLPELVPRARTAVNSDSERATGANTGAGGDTILTPDGPRGGSVADSVRKAKPKGSDFTNEEYFGGLPFGAKPSTFQIDEDTRVISGLPLEFQPLRQGLINLFLGMMMDQTNKDPGLRGMPFFGDFMGGLDPNKAAGGASQGLKDQVLDSPMVDKAMPPQEPPLGQFLPSPEEQEAIRKRLNGGSSPGGSPFLAGLLSALPGILSSFGLAKSLFGGQEDPRQVGHHLLVKPGQSTMRDVSRPVQEQSLFDRISPNQLQQFMSLLSMFGGGGQQQGGVLPREQAKYNQMTGGSPHLAGGKLFPRGGSPDLPGMEFGDSTGGVNVAGAAPQDVGMHPLIQAITAGNLGPLGQRDGAGNDPYGGTQSLPYVDGRQLTPAQAAAYYQDPGIQAHMAQLPAYQRNTLMGHLDMANAGMTGYNPIELPKGSGYESLPATIQDMIAKFLAQSSGAGGAGGSAGAPPLGGAGAGGAAGAAAGAPPLGGVGGGTGAGGTGATGTGGLFDIFQAGGADDSFRNLVQRFSMPSYDQAMKPPTSPLQRQATDYAGELARSDPFGQTSNIQNTLSGMISNGSPFDMSQFKSMMDLNPSKSLASGVAAGGDQAMSALQRMLSDGGMFNMQPWMADMDLSAAKSVAGNTSQNANQQNTLNDMLQTGGQFDMAPWMQSLDTGFAQQLAQGDPLGLGGNVQNTLRELIDTGGRFDNSAEYAAVEAQSQNRLGRELDEMNEQFGARGLRFGSDVSRGQGTLRNQYAIDSAEQRARIARESFESATNRRLQASTLPEQLRQAQIQGLGTTHGMALGNAQLAAQTHEGAQNRRQSSILLPEQLKSAQLQQLLAIAEAGRQNAQLAGGFHDSAAARQQASITIPEQLRQAQLQGLLNVAQAGTSQAQVAGSFHDSAANRQLQATTIPEQLRQAQLQGLQIPFNMEQQLYQNDDAAIQRSMAEFARTQGSLFPLLLQFALSGYEGDFVDLAPVEV